ncbi:hypothetical protein GCM10010402_34820 [Actinomadura luteofluorescens]
MECADCADAALAVPTEAASRAVEARVVAPTTAVFVMDISFLRFLMGHQPVFRLGIVAPGPDIALGWDGSICRFYSPKIVRRRWRRTGQQSPDNGSRHLARGALEWFAHKWRVIW